MSFFLSQLCRYAECMYVLVSSEICSKKRELKGIEGELKGSYWKFFDSLEQRRAFNARRKGIEGMLIF